MWSDQSAREYGTTPAQTDAGQGLGISRVKTNLDFQMNDVVVVLMGVKRRTGGNGKIHMFVLRQRMVLIVLTSYKNFRACSEGKMRTTQSAC